MKKMRKNIIFMAIIAITFIACNPNEDIYKAIDEKNNEAFHKTGIEYTISSADYSKISKTTLAIATNAEDSTFAKSIASYNSFNSKYTANEYIPEILANNFPAFKEGSSAIVTYNQYIGKMYGAILSSELTTADYDLMSGNVPTNHYFATTSEINSNIPSYLSTKYPDAVENNYAEVSYKYPDADTQAAGFYMYNGSSWSLVGNSYVLAENDYAAMGAPGAYNNFSEDAMPADYLPQFLNIKYPYAQAKEEKVILCDFYGYNDPTYAITCIYNGETWDINFPGLKTTAQFVHSEKAWLFDPTVTFTLGASDFQLIVDYIATIYPDLINSYGSGDYYTGASSYYSNFDIRVSKRRDKDPDTYSDLTDEEALALIWERVEEGLIIMLQQKYPEAVPNIDGIDVNYYLTFDTFNDAYQHIFYNAHYICTSSGTPPTFELVGTIDEVVTE